jgi:hypothetical protein
MLTRIRRKGCTEQEYANDLCTPPYTVPIIPSDAPLSPSPLCVLSSLLPCFLPVCFLLISCCLSLSLVSVSDALFLSPPSTSPERCWPSLLFVKNLVCVRDNMFFDGRLYFGIDFVALEHISSHPGNEPYKFPRIFPPPSVVHGPTK